MIIWQENENPIGKVNSQMQQMKHMQLGPISPHSFAAMFFILRRLQKANVGLKILKVNK